MVTMKGNVQRGRLKAAGLKLEPYRCDLLKRTVCFLGHVSQDIPRKSGGDSQVEDATGSQGCMYIP